MKIFVCNIPQSPSQYQKIRRDPHLKFCYIAISFPNSLENNLIWQSKVNRHSSIICLNMLITHIFHVTHILTCCRMGMCIIQNPLIWQF
jgi:hypothetical protein